MLKIKGLKKIAGISKDLNGRYHLQLNYDMETCAAWVDQHVGNSWTQYDDENVIFCGNIRHKTTMKEIRDMIAYAVSQGGYPE